MSAVAVAVAGLDRPNAPRPHLRRDCGGCRHFLSSPPDIERELPGLAALGSVYGSVRGADGLCRVHDRYLAASASCAAHEASAAAGRAS